MKTFNKAGLFFAMFALMATGPAFANRDAFVTACLESGNLKQAICECCADVGIAELSPAGFDYLTAMLKGDHDGADALRPTVPPHEIVKASMFMVNTPGRCAREASGKN